MGTASSRSFLNYNVSKHRSKFATYYGLFEQGIAVRGIWSFAGWFVTLVKDLFRSLPILWSIARCNLRKYVAFVPVRSAPFYFLIRFCHFFPLFLCTFTIFFFITPMHAIWLIHSLCTCFCNRSCTATPRSNSSFPKAIASNYIILYARSELKVTPAHSNYDLRGRNMT